MMSPSNARALHRDAMDRMDEHDMLVRSGKIADARLVALDALQMERRALRYELDEPFRSLVYRSAAAIALEAGLPGDALALVGEALAADAVPDVLATQLREIARNARQRSQSPMGDAT